MKTYQHLLVCLLFGLSLQASGTGPGDTNSTGRVDPTFVLQDTSFTTVLSLPERKYIVQGTFEYLGGTPLNRLARLNYDGTVDQSFDSGQAEPGTALRGVRIQPDRRLLAYGSFSNFHGAPRLNLVRLRSDGSLDTGFVPPADHPGLRSGPVSAVAIDGVNRLIYVGIERRILSSSTNEAVLFSLNWDGSVAASDLARSIAGVVQRVHALAVDAAGRLLVTGETLTNGSVLPYFTRLRRDGTSDPSFKRVTISSSPRLTQIVVQPDGKILLGGSFVTINGLARSGLVRFNPDASIDPSFRTGTGFDGSVDAVVLQADGRILAGGNFALYAGAPARRLARLWPDGGRDTNFVGTPNFSGVVSSLALDADGNLVVSGNFSELNGVRTGPCGRLLCGLDVVRPVIEPAGTNVLISTQLHPDRAHVLESTFDFGQSWRTVLTTNPVTTGLHVGPRPAVGEKQFFRWR